MTNILAVASQKGGVGKTTASINLAGIFAETGKTLLIDMDPQGNATAGVGVTDYSLTIAEVLEGKCKAQEAIIKTDHGELYVIPADISLAALETGSLTPFKLAQALKGVIERFEMIVIDCPPSLGLLTINGLAAANRVIVPVKPGRFAIQGLSQLAGVVESLRLRRINTGLRILGFFYNESQPRTQLFKSLDQLLIENYGPFLMDTSIPANIRLNEAQVVGEPVTIYDNRSKGAEAYRELTKEVVEKWQNVPRS